MEAQENKDEEDPKPLTPLDSALNELGMLATGANSRKEYFSEIRTRNYLNMLTINSRYVSNVSIGFRVRPSTPHVRYKPYQMPQRHRTKSENNDATENASTVAQKIVEDCLTDSIVQISQLKKAKSLECIIAEGGSECKEPVEGFFKGHSDLEQVSDAVQKLKVDE
ncbi:uncharacterized protein LOC126746692 isoform X1 [Anthonomus grandis grandis]|uniref:uncharacterized protein LOC126746692 isoform X1 n=1 Tax=Anthonomus grandis grandis TaxID=2921223 RepID=UPI002165A968|nr:uncharacterized protein LOC126746692 isoform X1 [Anthonomus grandis grandis]